MSTSDTPVTPPGGDFTPALLSLAVESWRFSRAYLRLVARLELTEQPRFLSQYRYFQKQVEQQLEAAGFKLVDLEGQSFDAGMAATAINLADFSNEDKLVVDQMLEPVIMDGQGLVKMGTVLLKRADRT